MSSAVGLAVSTAVDTNARYLPLAHTLCANEHPNTYMSLCRPVCFCGMMIWTLCASDTLGIGWLRMQMARTTCPTRRTLPGK